MYRVLKQYHETKNPLKKSGRPSGFKHYDLPPLSDRKRKKGEGYSTVEKIAVITGAKLGHSKQEIMDLTNLSKNVIPKILQDFSETSNPRTRPITKPARNSIINNPKMLDAICLFIEEHNDNNQIVTTKMVKNFLLEDYAAKLSKDSISRLLFSLGFHTVKPKIIPFLTENHILLRKQYAEEELKQS